MKDQEINFQKIYRENTENKNLLWQVYESLLNQLRHEERK